MGRNKKSILKMLGVVFSIGEQPLHVFFWGGGDILLDELLVSGRVMLVFSFSKDVFSSNILSELDQRTMHAFWVRFLVKGRRICLMFFLRNDPYTLLNLLTKYIVQMVWGSTTTQLVVHLRVFFHYTCCGLFEFRVVFM